GAQFGGERVTRVDQQAEQPLGAGTGPDGAELDVARPRASFGTRAGVADRHPLQAAGVVDQHGVPQPLGQDRLDLQADVAPGAARQRVRTMSASPKNRSGSGTPRKVPNATRQIRSASSRSPAASGRTRTPAASVTPVPPSSRPPVILITLAMTGTIARTMD